jgi:AbiTii
VSLLRELQNATYADVPLTAVLRRAAVFAARLEDPLLREWAYCELNGYPRDATLPTYRRSRPVVARGDFIVHGPEIPPPRPHSLEEEVARQRIEREFGRPFPGHRPIEAQLNDVLIDPHKVPPPERDRLFTHQFLQRVVVYEDWLRTQTDDMRDPWPLEVLARNRTKLGRGTCVEAWRVLPRPDLIAVVDGVLNRLLEFAVVLEREAPDAGDLPASQLRISSERMTSIINATIYTGVTLNDYSTHVQGNDARVVGGRGNRGVRQGDTSVTQQGVDLGPLLTDLEEAVSRLGGQLSAEQLDATQGFVDDVEAEAAAPQPARQRMLRALEGIKAIAQPAGTAGAAVIEAAQAIHRALGS